MHNGSSRTFFHPGTTEETRWDRAQLQLPVALLLMTEFIPETLRIIHFHSASCPSFVLEISSQCCNDELVKGITRWDLQLHTSYLDTFPS